MTEGLQETKSNVIHGVFRKSGESEKTEDLYKTDPIKYFFLLGRKAEEDLQYLEAASEYTNAYNLAVKEKKSSAVFLKWNAMRCVEYSSIYAKLLKQVVAEKGCGRRLSDGKSVVVSWIFDNEYIDKETLTRYKQKLPASFHGNVLVWNSETGTLRFLSCKNYFSESEPVIDAEYYVTKTGITTEVALPTKERKVILHKWMLGKEAPYNKDDRKKQIRRSIKIEFLRLPAFMQPNDFPKKDYWETYVTPALGNRSVGKLQKEYSAYLLNLTSGGTSCANSRPSCKADEDEIAEYYRSQCGNGWYW